MSSINGLQASANTLFLLQQYNAQNGGSAASHNAGTTAASAAVSSSAAASYGGTMTRQLQSMIELTRMAMDAMGIPPDGRATFGQISAYCDELQTKYTTALQEKMESIGLDPKMNFRLQSTADGAIMVMSDDANAAKLQALFDNDSELTKQYKQLEALSGLDEARSALQINPNDLRKRVQIESVASWWCTSGKSTTSSWFGNYTAQGLSMLSGINLNV